MPWPNHDWPLPIHEADAAGVMLDVFQSLVRVAAEPPGFVVFASVEEPGGYVCQLCDGRPEWPGDMMGRYGPGRRWPDAKTLIDSIRAHPEPA